MDWKSPLHRRPSRRIVAVLPGLALMSILSLCPAPRAESQEPAAEAPAAVERTSPVAPSLDPARVIGARACLDCHKSEYLAWMQTKHYDDHRLEGDRARELIEAYGDGRICLDCHKTPQRDRFGRVVAYTGVSCESCHGAAGSQQGWLNRHAVYGPNLTRMNQETPAHYETRIEFCDQAGMIRTSHIYELARNCYECHIVGNEKLRQAGHFPGQAGFELIPWVRGEVRHNFHMSQYDNAEAPSLPAARFGRTPLERQRVMFVVDFLVRMEVCLRNFAAVQPDNLGQDYAREWVDRADTAKDDFEEFVLGVLGDADIEDPDLTAAFDAADELGLGRRFNDQASALAAADAIGRAARSFVQRHDGSQLAALDENWEFLAEPQGEVFER
jgi:Cytochrome c554 and c-prime